MLNAVISEGKLFTAHSIVFRLQKSISDMELMSGVTCKTIDADTVIVEFPPRQTTQQPASKGDMPREELVLKVTLTFQENNLGYLHLSDVKVSDLSLPNSDCEDDGDKQLHPYFNK